MSGAGRGGVREAAHGRRARIERQDESAIEATFALSEVLSYIVNIHYGEGGRSALGNSATSIS
jgi:hypothetical protein